MNKTTIGWCTYTSNPLRARRRTATDQRSGHYCEKIAPECKHCYASAMQPRLFGLPEFQEQRQLDDLDLHLDLTMLTRVFNHQRPERIFWQDMSDLFGDWVPDRWLAECFLTMEQTPQHTHLVLTKRAKRMHDWLTAHYPTPLPNVHVGVSVGTQRSADTLIPWLMQTPAVLRFLSCEPLLEPVQLWRLGPWHDPQYPVPLEVYPFSGVFAMPDSDWERGKIGWVVVGGESGRSRRGMDVAWLIDIVDQCLIENVPVYVKQAAGLRPGQQGGIPDHVWQRKEMPI